MEFDDVQAFVSVANAGSVSRAAQELNLTQSAVTRRLQRLETSLGTSLLDRRTRPITLTATGRAALERCRRLLDDAREVRAAAADGNMPQGEVRIGVAHALTEFTLMEPVGYVRREFPRITLRLSTGWSNDLLERVHSRALDAAVILLHEGEAISADLTARNMGKERLVVVAPRGKDHSRVRKIRDVAGARWILNPEGCAARAALQKALQRAGIDLVVGVETYNYQLQLALVAKNRGFGLVPERILAHSKLRSQLRTLSIPSLSFPMTIWTVHRPLSFGIDPVIRELSRVLAERL
jgi:DNA-binding transcriptional LysR family regulator